MNIVAPSKSHPLGLLHRLLRAATRNDHMMIDRMILRLDLTRREDYGALLGIHHSTLQDLEPDWRAVDRDDFRGMLRCLQNDLRALGIATTAIVAADRPSCTDCDRLGIAYVIRGSRLGASIVRGRVASKFPATYLDFIPAQSWAQFLQKLEVALKEPDCVRSEVIRGARITFEMFADRLTRSLA